MVFNYHKLSSGAAINLYPVRDSNKFSQWADWKERQAYFFTGLDYPMLVCPFPFTYDEKLVERPGVFLKTNLSLGGVLYFADLPEHYNRNDFQENAAWVVDSYLFKLHSSHISSTRLYVDYANDIPNHGARIFDNARVFVTPEIRAEIELLYHQYSSQLFKIIASNPKGINVRNYRDTSLVDEICTQNDLISESRNYLRALIDNDPDLLNKSRLTSGFTHTTTSKKYNKSILSFYFAFLKELFPNSPGSDIGMFKNLYNILEYLMEGEGKNKGAVPDN